MAYMEIFGNCSQNNNEFLRYSVPAYSTVEQQSFVVAASAAAAAATSSTTISSNHSSSITHSHTMSLGASSITSSNSSIVKPALPSPFSSPSHSPAPPATAKPPALPPKSVRTSAHRVVPTPPASPKIELTSPQTEAISISPTIIRISAASGEDYEHLCDATSEAAPANHCTKVTVNVDDADDQVVLRRNIPREKVNGTILVPVDPPKASSNLLETVDVGEFLVFKKSGEDGPDIKGGTLDALIIHATKVTKKSDGKISFKQLKSKLKFFFTLKTMQSDEKLETGNFSIIKPFS